MRAVLTKKLQILAIPVLLGGAFLMAAPAHAACTNPAGTEGEMVYNADQNVPQVCTDAGWSALGPLNPAAGSSGCSNPTGTEGEVVYNTDVNKPQYCDGDDWVAMIGTVPSVILTGPSGCANIGDLCADGTVFAGWHPITSAYLFIPTVDQERPGSPGTYTMNWKNATGTDDINPDSDDDGQANHTNRGGAIVNFQAFQACEDLGAGGHSDWYLPSRVELYYLWSVHETIEAGGNITNFQNVNYWSSTDWGVTGAWTQNFTSSVLSTLTKTTNQRVRCLRQ